MSSKILEMAGRNPRSQTLSDPVWIKVSRVMDSGTAKSAAHIGRECVVHRTSTTPHLVAGPYRSAHRETRLSHCTIACVFLPSFPVPSCPRSLVSIVVAWYCLATGAQHDVLMRACHSHAQRTCQSDLHPAPDTARELLNLLDEALAETQHARRNMRDGKELPAPHVDASFPPRPGRDLNAVDDDGGDEHPHTRLCMHLQTTITSPCG